LRGRLEIRDSYDRGFEIALGVNGAGFNDIGTGDQIGNTAGPAISSSGWNPWTAVYPYLYSGDQDIIRSGADYIKRVAIYHRSIGRGGNGDAWFKNIGDRYGGGGRNAITGNGNGMGSGLGISGKQAVLINCSSSGYTPGES